MAKAAKPVQLQKKHLTKEEINERKEQEERLKGNDDKVYKSPKGLSKDGKKLYKFIVKELKNSGILCNLDITILELTVESIIRLKECKDHIDKNGMIITNKDGGMWKNPACGLFKDYNSIFNKCCMELGLSPSARARLANINMQKKENDNDPLLQVLKGGK